MKLQSDPIIPTDPQGLSFALKTMMRRISASVNGLIEGRLAAVDSFAAAPTTGLWQRGDFVRNSAPIELGAAASKYVIYGFLCIASGTPGTWVPCRFLTGN